MQFLHQNTEKMLKVRAGCERMKLKTLKDLPSYKEKVEVESFTVDKDQFVRGSELRQEAIKWIKEYPLWRVPRLSPETREWIKHFFNITEEDLK